jgi:hypothetical protein
MSTATIEIPDQLIQVLGAELRDRAKGFACQPDDAQANCHGADHPKDNFGFGDLWKGKDYAWRALLNPAFQVEVMLAIGNSGDHTVGEAQLDLVCPILEALSESMPDDATIDLMTEGDGAAEVLSKNLLAYFSKAKTTSRMSVGG